MTKIKHFEELWEKCERYHELNPNDTTESIIKELQMKIDLYQVIDTKEISKEDMEKIKSRTLGEILFTITNLSLKDNINVFEALYLSLREREHS